MSQRMFNADQSRWHKWKPGIIQFCAKCRWRRTLKGDTTGNATSQWTYALGERDFSKRRFTPPCGSQDPQAGSVRHRVHKEQAEIRASDDLWST